MSRTLARRIGTLEAKANARLARSGRVIWCEDPAHMPRMVDLLIAKGRIKESDRSRCWHWSDIMHPDALRHEDYLNMLDAEKMLGAEGTREAGAAGGQP
jgi:hypothetical protein